MKNIQVSEQFYIVTTKLVYSLETYELDPYTNNLLHELKGMIYAKADAMKRREEYTEALKAKQKQMPQ